MMKRLTASCGLCDYTVDADTEADAAAALFAHLRTVHPHVFAVEAPQEVNP